MFNKSDKHFTVSVATIYSRNLVLQTLYQKKKSNLINSIDGYGEALISYVLND